MCGKQAVSYGDKVCSLSWHLEFSICQSNPWMHKSIWYVLLSPRDVLTTWCAVLVSAWCVMRVVIVLDVPVG